MAIVGYLLDTVISYSTWILMTAMVALSVKWYLSNKKKTVDPFVGIPQIKPHWFWGNLGSIFGEEHFVIFYHRHYKVLELATACTIR